MSKLDTACQQLISDVSDALGAAIVDLSSGLLLAAHHNVPYFTQSYLDAVAAAAVDMFRGKNISTVETLLSNQRGTTVSNSIKEVQMSTSHTYHFMSIVPGKENCLMVLITGRKANLGMGWSALRTALPVVAPLCP
jgi:predicted regulator of Ras-like GTPase activity (Roadblock/LC7/MglB family)